MAGKVYFGNKNFQTWIDAPQSGMKASSQGYVNEQGLLNGRSFIKRSSASHRVFNASWLGSMNNATLADGLQVIKSFADGLYGTGPYYWLDPYAVNMNLMPPHWAAPMLSQLDWPDLDTSIIPTYTTPVTAAVNGYPYQYATYSMAGSEVSDKKFTIIIPTGYTLNFGWHSTAAGISSTPTTGTAGVRITPYNLLGVATSDVNPVSLAGSLAGGTTRTNQTFSGSTYSRVEIFIANGSTSVSAVNIVAMIAQVLINGTSVATGNFIPGSGTSGLEFASFPEIEYYSSAINSGQIGLSATLTEI